MPRIAGVDIPPNKRIEYALRYIHGVGPTLVTDILKEAQIEIGTKAKDLTEEEVARIAAVIDRGFQVEGQLRRMVQSNIARMKDIRCYRGMRHNARLNVTGTDWECGAGFRYLAGRCQPIRVPANANLNSIGTEWICNVGFRRVGNRCVLN